MSIKRTRTKLSEEIRLKVKSGMIGQSLAPDILRHVRKIDQGFKTKNYKLVVRGISSLCDTLAQTALKD